MNFLPISKDEMVKLGWTECDVILVTADAYVDHPSFGAALIGRFLESLGLHVGIISQPDWHSTNSFKALGRPRLFFGVTAGNLDSMVNLYTAQRKPRREDLYSENGGTGHRPYLSTIVYAQRIKEAFKGVEVVIGGVEASLRRISHYDYYTDRVKPSILLDSKADILVYGNAEAPLEEMIKRCAKGEKIRDMKDIRGTAVILNSATAQRYGSEVQSLPSHDEVLNDKHKFMDMTHLVMENQNPFNAKSLLQPVDSRTILINPPAFPLSTEMLDRVYGLKFIRARHPSYQGQIPALATVETSMTAHRGCYGGCHFCSLSLHQGRFIQIRSLKSILNEIEDISISNKGRKVVITDVGGPTANMYGTGCDDATVSGNCKRTSCLFPDICKRLKISPEKFLALLQEASRHPLAKSIYVNSGIRCDLALRQPGFIEILAQRHTQGRLSAAPEHNVGRVLSVMGKPGIKSFEDFVREFVKAGRKTGLRQFVVPYFIVGHPGADDSSERALKEYMRAKRYANAHIQEFYPTPMTISTAMYWTGIDFQTGRPVNVERRPGQKKKWKEM